MSMIAIWRAKESDQHNMNKTLRFSTCHVCRQCLLNRKLETVPMTAYIYVSMPRLLVVDIGIWNDQGTGLV